MIFDGSHPPVIAAVDREPAGRAAISLLRDAFVVPAPGAVVVGVPTNSRAHLIGMG